MLCSVHRFHVLCASVIIRQLALFDGDFLASLTHTLFLSLVHWPAATASPSVGQCALVCPSVMPALSDHRVAWQLICSMVVVASGAGAPNGLLSRISCTIGTVSISSSGSHSGTHTADIN